MGDGRRERLPRRFALLLIAAGASGMLPLPVVQRAHAALEELAWTLRGLLAPPAHEAAAATGAPAPASVDRRVAQLLAALRARVVPAPARGWQRDGDFAVALLVPGGEGSELRVRGPAALPPDEPAFHGDELVGVTVADARGTVRLERITRAGTRLPACAGVPGVRETRFLALGDGGERLRVAFADTAVPLEEGDLAWAIDPPPLPGAAVERRVGGARLGRLVRGPLPPGAERDDWRIEPLTPVEELAAVAIRLPPGFPHFDRVELEPLASALLPDPIVDPRRSYARLAAGREAGVAPGCAVALDGALLGRVVRSGHGHALVRTLFDPGLRVRALLLDGGRPRAFDLAVQSVDGSTIRIAPPELPAWDGALVVTASSRDGTPEGLLIGALRAAGGACELVASAPRFDQARRDAAGAAPRVAAWRPAGALDEVPP